MIPQVVIALPIYRQLEASTLLSVVNPCLRYPEWIRDVQVSANTYIDTARNELARNILRDQGATHLWFVDSDMNIPANALELLLAHKLPIVGGWYCGRDAKPSAYEINKQDGEYGPGYEINRLDGCEEGLQQVGGLPLGCTLIETKLLRAMREQFGDERWFVRDGIDNIGEDVWFHLRLREMGIAVYLDNQVQCGHWVGLLLTREMWDQKNKKQAMMAACSQAAP